MIADSETLQMDFFIEALKQNSVDVVKVFLDQIQIPKKFMHHLHMGRVLRLYTKVSACCFILLFFHLSALLCLDWSVFLEYTLI